MMGVQEVASHWFTGGTWKHSEMAPQQGDGIHDTRQWFASEDVTGGQLG